MFSRDFDQPMIRINDKPIHIGRKCDAHTYREKERVADINKWSPKNQLKVSWLGVGVSASN